MTNFLNTFVDNGYSEYANFFDKDKCKNLMNDALKSRKIDKLFLSEEEFKKERKFKGVNPVAGRNLLEQMNIDFIFLSEKFQYEMIRVCGNNYRILNAKFVMGIPYKFIPKWLERELKDSLVSNLGPYVREEYRDITYFRGIDFHQDIIDYPERVSDFITAYIYLDKVDSNSAPLYLLDKSHLLGASIFPHKLTIINDQQYKYINDFEDEIVCDVKQLINEGGSLYYWHCNMLHGTQPQISDEPRISVRILVEKNPENKEISLIDLANRKSKGHLSLSNTRRDLDEQGKGVVKGNIINKREK
jgi:hypothetical protein